MPPANSIPALEAVEVERDRAIREILLRVEGKIDEIRVEMRRQGDRISVLERKWAESEARRLAKADERKRMMETRENRNPVVRALRNRTVTGGSLLLILALAILSKLFPEIAALLGGM